MAAPKAKSTGLMVHPSLSRYHASGTNPAMALLTPWYNVCTPGPSSAGSTWHRPCVRLRQLLLLFLSHAPPPSPRTHAPTRARLHKLCARAWDAIATPPPARSTPSLPLTAWDRDGGSDRERGWVSVGFVRVVSWVTVGFERGLIRVRKGIRSGSRPFGERPWIHPLLPTRDHTAEERGRVVRRDPRRTRGEGGGSSATHAVASAGIERGCGRRRPHEYETGKDDGRGAARAATIAHVHVHVRRRSERSEGG